MRDEERGTPSPDIEGLRGLGARIAQLRSDRGWKQTELGRRAGLSPSRLSRLESGRAVPNLGELIRLRQALGADLEEIVFGGRAPSAESPRQLAMELEELGSPEELETIQRLLGYLVLGYRTRQKERGAC